MRRLLLIIALLGIFNTSQAQTQREKQSAFALEIGPAFHLDSNVDVSPLGFLSYDYSLNKRFSIGASCGLDFYDSVIGYLFANAKYYFIKDKTVNPFVGLRGGISYGEHGDNVIGLVANPEIGIMIKRFMIKSSIFFDTENHDDKKIRAYISLGYSLPF